jgi:hypothetical protein
MSPSNHEHPSRWTSADVIESLCDGEFIDKLADRLADLLLDRLAARLGLSPVALAERLGLDDPDWAEALVDAQEIARRTGRSRWWVYEHAGELGAVRLGWGPRPRLAFRPSRVEAYLESAAEGRQPLTPPVRARPRRRRSRRSQSGVELLPIQGAGDMPGLRGSPDRHTPQGASAHTRSAESGPVRRGWR